MAPSPRSKKSQKARRRGRVELVRGRAGQWHFRVRSGNHEIVAHGETLVGDSSKARRAWRALQRIVRGPVDVVVVTSRGGRS